MFLLTSFLERVETSTVVGVLLTKKRYTLFMKQAIVNQFLGRLYARKTGGAKSEDQTEINFCKWLQNSILCNELLIFSVHTIPFLKDDFLHNSDL